MRALLPWPVPDVDVHEFYARDWVDRGGVRADFVASVDGAIAVAGRSRGLQTPGDNRVFAALRDLADVVLVGAGTARSEGYQAVELSTPRQDIRRRLGLSAALVTAVVSNRLTLDVTTRLFSAATAANRTIVITCAAAPEDRRAELAEVAHVVVAGQRTVDLAAARGALAARGLTRVVCEGGPSLVAELIRQSVLDELCLSITPLLAGPGAARVTGGPAWPDGVQPVPLVLTGLLEEDGALFCRYRTAG